MVLQFKIAGTGGQLRDVTGWGMTKPERELLVTESRQGYLVAWTLLYLSPSF